MADNHNTQLDHEAEIARLEGVAYGVVNAYGGALRELGDLLTTILATYERRGLSSLLVSRVGAEKVAEWRTALNEITEKAHHG